MLKGWIMLAGITGNNLLDLGVKILRFERDRFVEVRLSEETLKRLVNRRKDLLLQYWLTEE